MVAREESAWSTGHAWQMGGRRGDLLCRHVALVHDGYDSLHSATLCVLQCTRSYTCSLSQTFTSGEPGTATTGQFPPSLREKCGCRVSPTTSRSSTPRRRSTWDRGVCSKRKHTLKKNILLITEAGPGSRAGAGIGNCIGFRIPLTVQAATRYERLLPSKVQRAGKYICRGPPSSCQLARS